MVAAASGVGSELDGGHGNREKWLGRPVPSFSNAVWPLRSHPAYLILSQTVGERLSHSLAGLRKLRRPILEGVMCLFFAGPWLSVCPSGLGLINTSRGSSLE